MAEHLKGEEEVGPGSELAFVPAFAPLVQTGTQFVRGAISVLYTAGTVAHEGDLTEPDALVGSRASVQISTDTKDDTRVLKVVDAIKCIEDFLNGSVIRDLLWAIVKGQLLGTQGPINNAFDAFAAALTECIRAKALGQTIVRVNGRFMPPRPRGRPKGSKNGTTSEGYRSRRRGAPGAG